MSEPMERALPCGCIEVLILEAYTSEELWPLLDSPEWNDLSEADKRLAMNGLPRLVQHEAEYRAYHEITKCTEWAEQQLSRRGSDR
jgi:hypothetical protein